MVAKHETQQLFSRAAQQVNAGKAPLDENALDVRIMPSFSRVVFALTGSDFDSLLRYRSSEEIYQSKCRHHQRPCRS